MTLYEITNEYRLLLDMAEMDDIDPEIISDTLEAVQGDLEFKADGYCTVIKELEAQAAKFDEEIKRLTARKTTMENNVKRLKESMIGTMTSIGKPKLTTEHFKISVVKNGGLQPMMINTDLSTIPEEYLIREPKPDTKKIREALVRGEELNFAHLEPRGQHLSVR